MLRHGLDRFFRPSPGFTRFVATPTATVAAGVIAVAALLGAAIQLWRTAWIDGTVTLVLGAVFGGWAALRVRGGHGRQAAG